MSASRPEIAELAVTKLGARGDGIALHEGRPVYLPYTAPGDRVRARLGAPREAGRAGTVLELLAPGARRTPACPHFGTCGGCALQHLPEETYSAFKLDLLRTALAHRGLSGIEQEALRSFPPGTRRRARLALRRLKNGETQVGFHARDSHDIVDMRACPVLHPRLVALVAPLRKLAAAFLQPRGSGAATMTLLDGGIDLLLDLPRHPDLSLLEGLAAFAHAQDLARLGWREGEKGVPTPAAERRPARAILGGVAVDVPPEGFLQASVESERLLSELVLAGVGAAKHVLDLHAGLGTFTFALAARASLHAVDGSRPAIAALVAAAARAGIAQGISTETRDLEVRPLLADELRRFDAAVFDPPRAGAPAQAAALAASTVPRVVAVSCNPATFARDARLLVDGGYRLTRLVPVDQFLWSPHLELVAFFER